MLVQLGVMEERYQAIPAANVPPQLAWLKRMRSDDQPPKADFRQRLGSRVFRRIGPSVRFLLRHGLGEPNVLLIVRGRRSGKPRTTPVAMFEFDDRRFVEAAFGQVDSVRNLRASGEAVIRRGRWSQTVRAVELPPEAAGKLMHDALAGSRRRRLLRSLLGPSIRPPAAILYR
jgi:deazaflavin-dependent oxidoreductase (nitroreductase family)